MKRHREQMEGRLREPCRARPPALGGLDPDGLVRVCAAIGEWLDRAGDAERLQVLEALQIADPGDAGGSHRDRRAADGAARLFT